MSQPNPTQLGSRLSRGLLLLAALVLWPAASARADEIAIWNFNDSDLAADHGTGTLTTNFVAANIGFSTPGSTINARAGDPAGLSLALQNGTGGVNNGASLTMYVSTEGFENTVVSFAAQRTSTGFSSNQFQYSLDGMTLIDFGPAFMPAGSFALVSFDLSTVAGLNNNPLAAFRIIFNGGSTSSSSGNNRIDNLVVEGTQAAADPAAVSEPTTMLLLGTGLAGSAAVVRRRRQSHDGTKV